MKIFEKIIWNILTTTVAYNNSNEEWCTLEHFPDGYTNLSKNKKVKLNVQKLKCNNFIGRIQLTKSTFSLPYNVLTTFDVRLLLFY